MNTVELVVNSQFRSQHILVDRRHILVDSQLDCSLPTWLCWLSSRPWRLPTRLVDYQLDSVDYQLDCHEYQLDCVDYQLDCVDYQLDSVDFQLDCVDY